MNPKLKLTLKSITHSGAHIGRDITLKVSSSELGVDFEIKKDVLPDKTTVLNKELYNLAVETSKLDIPLTVTVIERDVLFNDKGSMYQRLYIPTDSAAISEHTVTVKVYENRLFFWRKPAKFDVVFEVETTPITPPKRIPTVDDPEWTGDFNDDTVQMIFARVIFGEARETTVSDDARIAVGWSVRNRVEFSNPERFGSTYHRVILKPNQYSSFLESEGDNYKKVQNPHLNANSIDIQAWKNCYKIAGDILNNHVSDPTHGADHFIDNRITPPNWAEPQYFTMKIDKFSFYDVP